MNHLRNSTFVNTKTLLSMSLLVAYAAANAGTWEATVVHPAGIGGVNTSHIHAAFEDNGGSGDIFYVGCGFTGSGCRPTVFNEDITQTQYLPTGSSPVAQIYGVRGRAAAGVFQINTVNQPALWRYDGTTWSMYDLVAKKILNKTIRLFPGGVATDTIDHRYEQTRTIGYVTHNGADRVIVWYGNGGSNYTFPLVPGTYTSSRGTCIDVDGGAGHARLGLSDRACVWSNVFTDIHSTIPLVDDIGASEARDKWGDYLCGVRKFISGSDDKRASLWIRDRTTGAWKHHDITPSITDYYTSEALGTSPLATVGFGRRESNNGSDALYWDHKGNLKQPLALPKPNDPFGVPYRNAEAFELTSQGDVVVGRAYGPGQAEVAVIWRHRP